MCPFLNEEDDYSRFEQQEYEEEPEPRSSFFKDDRKFFIIGGTASVIAFCSVAYFMYSNSKPVDIDDLPVIKADTTPIKVKPSNNVQVSHQDKIVYDNVSGEKRKKEEEHVIAPPEEILSINEMDSDGVLSEEEKQQIINAFDELAPEKEYKIEYLNSKNPKKNQKVPEHNYNSSENIPAANQSTQKFITENENIKIVEEESLPPIKRIDSNHNSNKKNQEKKKKGKLSDLVERKSVPISQIPKSGGSIMVQIASLPTKGSAEVEYRRLSNRNKVIKKFHKQIFKVDLGKTKGTTYRVQIGPFKDSHDAQKIISILKKNGCNAYISR